MGLRTRSARWAIALAVTAGGILIQPYAFAATSPSPGGGVINVVGGSRAAEGEFPWMVRLSMGCGGALYSKQLVLTAAHCVADRSASSISATTGSVDLLGSAAVVVGATQVYLSPTFDWNTFAGDWALVKLASPVDLATLPLQASSPTGGTFTIMGWGSTREGGPQQRYLRKATVPFVSDQVCGPNYEAIGFPYLNSDMLCAGNVDIGGIDSCQGDSGGPMVRRNSAMQLVQVGIVSWGNSCAQPDYPGVYTEVATFFGAIQSAAATL